MKIWNKNFSNKRFFLERCLFCTGRVSNNVICLSCPIECYSPSQADMAILISGYSTLTKYNGKSIRNDQWVSLVMIRCGLKTPKYSDVKEENRLRKKIANEIRVIREAFGNDEYRSNGPEIMVQLRAEVLCSHAPKCIE